MIAARAQRAGFVAALLIALFLAMAFASAARADVRWRLHMEHGPANFAPGGEGTYAILAHNEGSTDSDSPYSIVLELPPGVTATGLDTGGYSFTWNCGSVTGQSTVTCTNPFPATAAVVGAPPADPRGVLPMLLVNVSVDGAASGGGNAVATISGGDSVNPGAQAFAIDPTTIDPSQPGFGLSKPFSADTFSDSAPDASSVRQAGGHQFEARFDLDFNLKRTTNDVGTYVEPDEHVKTVETSLPRGFVGDPEAAPTCMPTQLSTSAEQYGSNGSCPVASQIGTIDLILQDAQSLRDVLLSNFPNVTQDLPVYNMEPPRGALADFAFALQGVPVHIIASLDPTNHYAAKATIGAAVELYPVRSAHLTLWGVPADPSHDNLRFEPHPLGGPAYYGTPAGTAREPFLSLPTNCLGPDTIDLSIDSWQHPGLFKRYASEPAQMNGCNQLDFGPTIEAKPTTNLTDSPSGIDVNIHVPQNEDPDGRATAHLKDASVTLPEGFTVNPASAAGLGACSPEQVGLTTPVGQPDAVFTGEPERCPDGAKLGTLSLETPVLDHPLAGEVFLASQGQNPFGSLLALYFAIEDERTGVNVKLAGEVKADPQTGRLTTVFKQSPQLPFEDLDVHLFEGPRAALKTPSTCATHTTTSTLVPWSSPEGADASPSSSFELIQGPGGGACLPAGAAAPNAPAFSAGTIDPTAKAFSPFVLKLTRADGTQRIRAIETTLPKGLLAKLAGTTYCSDAALSAAAAKSGKAEQGTASCPASSHVGSVTVGAGAGSTPLYVGAEAYLSGPYKGAPLSLAIITPAVAGPFDLGTVVVRAALHVNSETAQVHAVSDEIPQILQGIPLEVRSIALRMDRPSFTLNPSSCDPMSIDGSALTVFGQSAPLSSRFQVGECGKLGFKPKLAIKLKGGTKRGGHPALTAVLKARPGDANIATTTVSLPHSEFLAQSHIRTICTRVQFAADSCPRGSVYGTATATTPLLDETLRGNVYLRSSSNPLPDIVIALKGKIDVDLVGRIDSTKGGGIRTTFASVPDAPVSKFTLKMAGGKKSLLENSKNLCASTNKATVQMGAQNGAQFSSRPVVKAKGCKGKARKGKGAGKNRGGKG